jgi:hypothetical protein
MESLIFGSCVLVVIVFWWARVWYRLFGWYIVESSHQEDVKKGLQAHLYQLDKALGPDTEPFLHKFHTVLRVKWAPGVLRRIFGFKPMSISYAQIGDNWYRLPGVTKLPWFVSNCVQDEELRLYRRKSAVAVLDVADALSVLLAEAQQGKAEPSTEDDSDKNG